MKLRLKTYDVDVPDEIGEALLRAQAEPELYWEIDQLVRLDTGYSYTVHVRCQWERTGS